MPLLSPPATPPSLSIFCGGQQWAEEGKNVIETWSIADTTLLRIVKVALEGYGDTVCSMTVAPDGLRAYVGTDDYIVYQVTPDKGCQASCFLGVFGAPSFLRAFLFIKKHLSLSLSLSLLLSLWDPSTAQCSE